ncbi:PA2779 family protein [Haliea sp. E17]|uniref:PA2779 family protein n=1 Tax=Haliea sp. E17 TaxID=3401576 RepID=UPI003AABE463
MNMHTGSAKRFIVMMLLLTFTTVGLQAPAYAAMLSTQQIAAQGSLQAERDQLHQRVMRDDVRAQLVEMGVSPDTVSDRINSLTSAEIAQVNGQLDALPAGSGVLGTVVLVLLILILLEVAGVIDIFPKL